MIFPLIEEFYECYSERARRYLQTKMQVFGIWLDKKKTSIYDLSPIEMRQFLEKEINSMQVRAITKHKFAQAYSAYFEFCIENGILEKSPFPKIPAIRFEDHISDKLAKKALKPLLYEDAINKLIAHAWANNKRMYVFLVLLAHNGIRCSELRSLKLDLIDLNINAFGSGIIPGAMKKLLCLYFIPDSFAMYLRNYIEELKRLYTNPEFLFFEPTSEEHFISERSVCRDLWKYAEDEKLNCKVNPHSFRDCLNSIRLNMDCPDSVMAILLNQEPKGTNAGHYLKLLSTNILERRKWWVRFTPTFRI
jgi:site-specific recombinase XerD